MAKISESEEMMNKYYAMTSSLTGKSIKELQGNQFKNNYNEKDCKSKEIILKTLNKPMTSRQLWNIISNAGYEGKYDTFTSLLVRYRKYGYIEKVNNTKPFIYGLTSLGYEHSKNPYIAREEQRRQYRTFLYDKIGEILKDSPEIMQSLIETLTGMNLGGNSGIGGGTGGGVSANNNGSYFNDFGSEKDNHELIKEVKDNLNDKDYLETIKEKELKELTSNVIKIGDENLLNEFVKRMRNTKKYLGGSPLSDKKYKPNKSTGIRKYYYALISCINKRVTKSVYEKIPFKFIIVGGKGLRLQSKNIAGTYVNNKDAFPPPFDYINKNYFKSKMKIRATKNNNSNNIKFYYFEDGNKSNEYLITEMNIKDFNKIEKQMNNKP
ncbi:MAG: hypothetical protein ACOCQD_01990 [archaeon]